MIHIHVPGEPRNEATYATPTREPAYTVTLVALCKCYQPWLSSTTFRCSQYPLPTLVNGTAVTLLMVFTKIVTYVQV